MGRRCNTMMRKAICNGGKEGYRPRRVAAIRRYLPRSGLGTVITRLSLAQRSSRLATVVDQGPRLLESHACSPRLGRGLVPSIVAVPHHLRQGGKAPNAGYARGERCAHRRTFAAGPVQKPPSRYTCMHTSASGCAPSHLGTRIKLRHLSQISTWNRRIQRPIASAPWFGTILALVSNHPRRVRLPPVTGARKTWETTRKGLSGRRTPEDSGSLFVWCSVRWPVG